MVLNATQIRISIFFQAKRGQMFSLHDSAVIYVNIDVFYTLFLLHIAVFYRKTQLPGRISGQDGIVPIP